MQGVQDRQVQLTPRYLLLSIENPDPLTAVSSKENGHIRPFHLAETYSFKSDSLLLTTSLFVLACCCKTFQIAQLNGELLLYLLSESYALHILHQLQATVSNLAVISCTHWIS